MKLLLFSDLHCSRQFSQRLVELSNTVDVVIGAGDFGNMRHDVDTAIGLLNAIDKPALLVPGNAESAEELRRACDKWPSATVLHGNGTTVRGQEFFGVGGAIPVTPFGSWSYDLTEAEGETLLAGCPERCVLITHSPPKGAVDVSSRGQSLGSQAVLNAIVAKQPLLNVCGHIHGSAGRQAIIGATTVINAGPAGVIFDLATLQAGHA